MSVTGTSEGSVATYTCDKGFTMSGSATRTCTGDQTWRPAAPYCSPTGSLFSDKLHSYSSVKGDMVLSMQLLTVGHLLLLLMELWTHPLGQLLVLLLSTHVTRDWFGLDQQLVCVVVMDSGFQAHPLVKVSQCTFIFLPLLHP